MASQLVTEFRFSHLKLKPIILQTTRAISRYRKNAFAKPIDSEQTVRSHAGIWQLRICAELKLQFSTPR
jgi:hypothetical protein